MLLNPLLSSSWASGSTMKIGQLAQKTGTAVETIRYYEREGLLPRAARTEGNYRIYDAGHLEILMFIRRCRSLDMSLDEIRVLLRFKESPSKSCENVNALLDNHIRHVSDRIWDLQQLERQLQTLRGYCQEGGQTAECGILNELSHGITKLSPSHAPESHISSTHAGGRRFTEPEHGED